MVAPSVCWRIRVAGTLAWSLSLYWVAIFPRARLELRRWRRRARAIPDPLLRGHALHKLRTEHLTAEGAAAFAILARAGDRAVVVRLCVAFEVMYDFIDALAEEQVGDVLLNNRTLYGALAVALTPGAPACDFYRHLPQHEDGGYLHALIDTCQRSLGPLRSCASVLPALRRLASWAEEAQSHHHAASFGEHHALAAWARRQLPASDLRWWEMAAAAGSPLGVFALVAAASHAQTSERDAQLVERAYFPWIAALSWLLESLVDQHDDAATGHPSYVAYYASPQEVTERLGTIARRAAEDARRLPRADRHTVLLAGMVSLNLSHQGAEHPLAAEAAAAVREAIGGPVVPLLAVLRLRRRFSSQRSSRLCGEGGGPR